MFFIKKYINIEILFIFGDQIIYKSRRLFVGVGQLFYAISQNNALYMSRKVYLLLLFIPICLSLSGTTYYISPNGNDSNPGTVNQPFFTLNKAWSVFNAGDIIYLRGGTYSWGQSITSLNNKSGSSGNLIKIFAYPNELPVIDYSGVTFSKDC